MKHSLKSTQLELLSPMYGVNLGLLFWSLEFLDASYFDEDMVTEGGV